jgi:phage I-like protein
MTHRVTAAFIHPLDASQGTIVFMPEGTHSITACVDGSPKTIEVVVDSRVLAAFNEDLKQRQESNVRPFGGFDHQKGAASFIPLEFRYEDGVGLMLDVEWTQAGRQAIEGKDYSYFSPSFILKGGIPLGLPKRGEVGSLVNDPAFEDIPRIAASNQLQHSDMEHLVNLGLISPETKEEDALVEAEATVKGLKDEVVKAELSLQEATEQIKVESASTEKELADLKIRHDKLTEDHDALLAKMDAGAEASASAAVEDAVTSGRIAPKDEAAKTFWKESIIAKPESARVLASMTANPVLSGETILAGRSVGREIEKEMNRCDFDALTPGERLSYVQAGGTIQDDAS